MLHFLARKIEKLTVKKSPPISESLPIHVQQIRHSDHSGYDSGNVGLCGGLVSIISLQPMWWFGDEPGLATKITYNPISMYFQSFLLLLFFFPL